MERNLISSFWTILIFFGGTKIVPFSIKLNLLRNFAAFFEIFWDFEFFFLVRRIINAIKKFFTEYKITNHIFFCFFEKYIYYFFTFFAYFLSKYQAKLLCNIFCRCYHETSPKFLFMTKIAILTKIRIFVGNFDFWRKFWFFDVNFDLWRKFRFWQKILFFDVHFDFWRKFRFWQKFWFSPVIFIFD